MVIFTVFSRTLALASFYDARQGTIKTDFNATKKILMTVGTDRAIKVNFAIAFVVIDSLCIDLDMGSVIILLKKTQLT